MSDHDGLLRAVCADPEDDLPRLVFADWFEENGDPARAEFIRVQCEIAASAVPDPALVEREAELLAGHGARWREPFANFGENYPPDVEFRRGFAHALEIDDTDDEFSDYAEELFRVAPIRQIRFFCAYTHTKRASCPELARLVVLGTDRAGFEPDELAHLFASPYLGGLRRLELRGDDDNGHLCEAGLALISGCPNLPSLRELDLSGNWCNWTWGNEGWAAALVGGPLLNQLDSLSLACTEMSDASAELLANSPRVGRLRHLDLCRNSLTIRGLFALAGSLHLTDLKTLDLRHNHFDREDPNALPSEVAHAALRERFGDGVLLGET